MGKILCLCMRFGSIDEDPTSPTFGRSILRDKPQHALRKSVLKSARYSEGSSNSCCEVVVSDVASAEKDRRHSLD